MFEINSYIKIPGKTVTNLQEAVNNPSQYFVDLNDRQMMADVAKQLDPEYLEGVIRICYNGQALLDYRHWDLIDQLWSYFINLLDEFLSDNHSEIYFPDQPIKIELRSLSEDLLLLIVEDKGSRKTTLPKREFIKAILAGGKEFFHGISNYLIPEDQERYEFELELIQKISRRNG